MRLDNVLYTLQHLAHQAEIERRPLENILFYGPHHLSQKVFSYISTEMLLQTKFVSAEDFTRPGDFVALLTHLKMRHILFVDEIHKLNQSVAAILSSVMADYSIDMIIGNGAAAKNVRLKLAQITFLAATTQIRQIPQELQMQFTQQFRLDI